MPFTISGIHHIGITVRDIPTSVAWYERMFGLTAGPVGHGDGEKLGTALQVPGVVLSFSLIQIGNTRLEFLQYHEPPGASFDRTNGDVGSSHVCFEVDDIEAAYLELKEKGALFNAPPDEIPEGELAGTRWAYFRDPDGIQLEIMQTPGR